MGALLRPIQVVQQEETVAVPEAEAVEAEQAQVWAQVAQAGQELPAARSSSNIRLRLILLMCSLSRRPEATSGLSRQPLLLLPWTSSVLGLVEAVEAALCPPKVEETQA